MTQPPGWGSPAYGGSDHRPYYGPPQYPATGYQPPVDGSVAYGPPVYPPPAYGLPGPGLWGPAPRRSRLPWILGGIGVLVVLAVVGVLVITLGGRHATGGPRAAADAFLSAAQHDDATAARTVTCPSFYASVTDGSGTFAPFGPLRSYRITSVDQNGDRATVDATITGVGVGATVAITTQRQSGAWLVCGAQISSNPVVPLPSFGLPSLPSFPSFPSFPSIPGISFPSLPGLPS